MLKRRPHRPRWLPLLLLSLCIVDTASDFENAGNARSKETMRRGNTNVQSQPCTVRDRFHVAITSPQNGSEYFLQRGADSTVHMPLQRIRLRTSQFLNGGWVSGLNDDRVSPYGTVSVNDVSEVVHLHDWSHCQHEDADCQHELVLELTSVFAVDFPKPLRPGENVLRFALEDAARSCLLVDASIVFYLLPPAPPPMVPSSLLSDAAMQGSARRTLQILNHLRLQNAEAIAGWSGRSDDVVLEYSIWQDNQQWNDNAAVVVLVVRGGDGSSCLGNYARFILKLDTASTTIRTGCDIWTGGLGLNDSWAGVRGLENAEAGDGELPGECMDVGTASISIPFAGDYEVQVQHMFTGYEGTLGRGVFRSNLVMVQEQHVHFPAPPFTQGNPLHGPGPELACKSHADASTGYWRLADQSCRGDAESCAKDPGPAVAFFWQPLTCSIGGELTTAGLLRLLGDKTVTIAGTSRQRTMFYDAVRLWHGGKWNEMPRQKHVSLREGPWHLLWSGGTDDVEPATSKLNQDAPAMRSKLETSLCEEHSAKRAVFLSGMIEEALLAMPDLGWVDNVRGYYMSVVQHALGVLRRCTEHFQLFVVSDLPTHCLPEWSASGCPGHIGPNKCSLSTKVDVCNPYEPPWSSSSLNSNRIHVLNEIIKSVALEVRVPFIDVWNLALSFPNQGGEPYAHYYSEKDFLLGNAVSKTVMHVLLRASAEWPWRAGLRASSSGVVAGGATPDEPPRHLQGAACAPGLDGPTEEAGMSDSTREADGRIAVTLLSSVDIWRQQHGLDLSSSSQQPQFSTEGAPQPPE